MTILKIWLDRICVSSLCILIFTLPFSKSAVEIFFVIALVAWAAKNIFFDAQPRSLSAINNIFTGINLFVCIFVFASFLSVCFSGSLALSFKGFFFKLLQGVLLFFIIYDTVENKEKLDLVLTAMVLSMVLIGANGVFQLITGKDFIRGHSILRFYDIHGMRMRSSFDMPQAFASWLTLMIPLGISIAVSARKDMPIRVPKSIMWLLICVLTACLFMTRSKGAFAGAIFAIIFFIMAKKRKVLVLIVVIVIATALALALLMNKDLLNNEFLFCIKDNIVATMLKLDIIRTNLWREAILIIKDFPVFGCGLNTYSVVAQRYKSDASVAGIYPHNSYLQMAAETGLIGLASFVLFLAALFAISLNNMAKIRNDYYRNLSLGLLTGLAAFLVHSLFDVNFYTLQLANLMWFIMGLIVAIQKIGLKEKSV